jgi:hypothetical protein
MKPFLPSTKPNSVFRFELFLSAGDQGATVAEKEQQWNDAPNVTENSD